MPVTFLPALYLPFLFLQLSSVMKRRPSQAKTATAPLKRPAQTRLPQGLKAAAVIMLGAACQMSTLPASRLQMRSFLSKQPLTKQRCAELAPALAELLPAELELAEPGRPRPEAEAEAKAEAEPEGPPEKEELTLPCTGMKATAVTASGCWNLCRHAAREGCHSRTKPSMPADSSSCERLQERSHTCAS
jgi:hypothetical protein